MGSTKTTSNTTVTATDEEKALEAQELDMAKFMAPYQKQLYSQLSGNISAILTGQTPQAVGIGGIDQNQVNQMVTSSNNALYPQFQASGIMDSGISAALAGRNAADIQNSNAQFNVSARQNLFNIAAGGQSNLQAQGTSLSSVLGSQLAGLRSTSTSGSTTKAWGDYAMDYYKANASVAAAAAGACWVAAQVFDGWEDYRTISARHYIIFHSPEWFKKLYTRFGESIANFISDKPILKDMIRPLFVHFSKLGFKKVEA